MADDQDNPMEPQDLYADENKKSDEALAKALGPRLRTANKRLQERIKEADEYARYLDGRGITKNSMQDQEDTYHLTDFPLHYQLKSALVPMLVSRWPKWMISNLHSDQGEVKDEEFQKFRRLMEALLDKIWSEYDLQQQLRYAVEEVIPLGLSAFCVGFDPEKRLPSAQWISGRQILIDPDGGPMPASWRWVAERQEAPVEELRVKYPDFEWNEPEGTQRTMFDEADRKADVREREVSEPTDETTETRKYFVVYLRGDMPTHDDADTKTKSPKGRPNEVVILTDEDQPRVVTRYKWPWVFDLGDFPIEVLRFTFDSKEAHPPSMLRPGHSLQTQASWNLTFFNTAMRLSVIRKVLVNTAYIADSELELLEAPTDLEFIQVDDPAAFNAIKIVSLMDQFPQALSTNLQTNAEIYREVMGVNEIIRESKSHTTAVDVSLQEQRAQQRLGVFIAQVERLVTNVARKLIQVAMHMTKTADLVRWLGEIVQATPDETGGMISDGWNEGSYTAEMIRTEKSIRVEPDSLRHVSKDQRVQEMGMMLDRVTQSLGLMKDLGLPLDPIKIAEIQMNFLRRLASESGIQNVEDLFPKKVEEMFQQGLPPAGAPSPEAAAGPLPPDGGTAPGAPVLPPPPGVGGPAGPTGPIPGAGGPGGGLPPLPPEALQALGLG